jgi:hypothetical protein
MPAPQEIVELVERFEDNLAAYPSGTYNETQFRREFIDPFYKALGWDIDNTAGNAESGRLKKGIAGVDEAFLREIETWRDLLARNIALRNSDLNQPELNTAVTLTINRIIFLRICEDRGSSPTASCRPS